MTSFSYNVSFNESEVIALKDALEFYVSEEAMLKLGSKGNRKTPYHFHLVKELLNKLRSYENAHFVSSPIKEQSDSKYLDEFLQDFSVSLKLELLRDVLKILNSKAPLIEFNSTSNQQIIMSPSFQHRILDALIELMPTHHVLVKEIFVDSKRLVSFTSMFVHFYREKTLNGDF